MENYSFSASIQVENTNIAKVVLMPGDPLRAKYIAENYLENPICFNTVRNMFGYTGTYKGKQISVMGSGMGCPSIALYAHELFTQFDVDCIIRVGTAGGLSTDVKPRDVIIAMTSSSNSSLVTAYDFPGYLAPCADYEMLSYAVEAAKEKGIRYRVGNVNTSDLFYSPVSEYAEKLSKLGLLATEMEIAGLYITASVTGKRALGMVTISDHLVTGESLTPLERQESFTDMMEIAMETAYNTLD